MTDIENMDLTTKRGHLTIKLQVHGENCKVMLRSGQETKTWFDMIMVNIKPQENTWSYSTKLSVMLQPISGQ